MNLPQVATSYYAEKRARQKPWILVTGITQRLPFLTTALVALIFGREHPQWVVVAVVLGAVITAGSFGVTAPAWSELIAKSIPENRRGILMGTMVMLGNALGALGGLVVARVLGSGLEFPSNYACLFLIAAGIMALSYTCFALNREPIQAVPPAHRNLREYIGSLPAVLRSDRPFAWYLVYQALSYSVVMGMGLFMVYAVKAYGVSEQQTGAFVTVSMVSTLVAAPVLGRLADVSGNRLILAIGQVSYISAVLLVVAVRDVRVMFAAFALLSIAQGGQIIAARNLVYQLAPEGRRPTYVALFGALPAPFALGFSLLGGWLARGSATGCLWAFGASAVFTMAGVVVLLTRVQVRRPLQQPALDGMNLETETAMS
jgi:MFS family permease